MTPLEHARVAHANAKIRVKKLALERREFKTQGKPYPRKLELEYAAALNNETAALNRYQQIAGCPPPGEEHDTDEPPKGEPK